MPCPLTYLLLVLNDACRLSELTYFLLSSKTTKIFGTLRERKHGFEICPSSLFGSVITGVF